MSKKLDLVGFPVALNDFRKENGAGDTSFATEGPSMTRQEFMEECDINTIMSRYDAYLADPTKSIREERYIDFTSVPGTLMESMNLLNQARDAFFTLPAVVRREFDNDPAMWADYAANPENLGQMREWGLAPPEKAPESPMKVEVVNPPPPPEKPPGDAGKA